jgi:tetratricopeptide (TPR) repeat protein/predicted Ser/Thr protein kinase
VTCPDDEELELHLTRPPGERSPEVTGHVSSCESCRRRAEAVSENLRVASSVGQAVLEGEVDDAPGPTPERVGPFRILGELGRGGMGVVYLAEQDRPRRRVALKVLRPGPAGRSLRRRFEHEANLLAQLRHPGIAQVYEAGVAESGPYFAMELVEGERLDHWVKQGPDQRTRLRLLADVCDAVHHAHLHGVIHRDLKPGNVLVQISPDGGGAPRVKVLDFGVARAVDSDLQTMTAVTEVGQLLGTVPFMSPEQVAGDPSSLDARSDVYSLGVLGYWLLTGRLPYDLKDRSVPEIARIIRDDDPATLSSVDTRLRGDVDTIIAKALAKERERRYASASELAADIRRHLDDRPIEARPPGTVYQLRKFARRNRVLVGATAVLLVVLAAAAAGGSWLALRATRAERAAREQVVRAETEAAKQEAVNEFLQGMLSSVDPWKDGDRATTVLDVLDRAAEDLDAGKLEPEPEVAAAVRASLGNSYWSMARYAEAEAQFRATLAVLKDGLPVGAERYVRTLSDLGLLMAETSRFAEAESTFRRQVDVSRELLGDGHEATIASLSTLSGVVADRGRYAEAESLIVEALERSAGLTGEGRAVHAANLHTLAALRHFRGDHRGAEQGFEESLALYREVSGPDHPSVLAGLDALGTVREGRGDVEGALATRREALSLTRTIFGADHPRVAVALNSLGDALVDVKRMDEAEPILREALRINRALNGEHRETARSLNGLAQALRLSGRLAEAEPLYHEALAMTERVLGPDHLAVANTAANLASLRAAQGRAADAESLLARTLAIRRASLGEENPLTRAAAESLAGLRRPR